MRRNIFLAAAGLFLAWTGCSSIQQQASQEEQPSTNTESLLTYQDEITTDFLRRHLSIFAADSMEGRETAAEGQKKAARYLADQYRLMDLKPVGDDSTYYQNFKLNAIQRDSVVFETFAMEDGQKRSVSRAVASKNTTADYIRAFGGTDTLQGEIVFAGFGVNDPDRSIRHLEGVDLQGKWVMVFQEIPHMAGGDTLIDPSQSERVRLSTILSRGAEGILLISDMSSEAFRESASGMQYDFKKPTD